ncbi:MAG: hypothetical protein ACE5I3_02110 [Phycisphaerae bacterium]
MSPPQQSIFGMVATIRRHWLRRQLVGHLAVGLIVLLGWLLVMVVLDNLAMLSWRHFVLAWVALAAGLAGWAVVFARRVAFGRPSAARLALLYEARVPGRENRLINAVQFLESRQAQRDALAYATVIENATALDPRTAPQAIDRRPVRNALIGLGVCAALLLGYAGLRPQWAGNALARLFRPFTPMPHLLATEPVVSPGNVELVEGAPLTIEARVLAPRVGRAPDRAYVEYRLAELDWTRSAMHAVNVAAGLRGGRKQAAAGAPAGRDDRLETGPTSSVAAGLRAGRSMDGTFRCEFDSVRHPLVYRVRAGRSVSPTYVVTLQYRPRVEQLRLNVRRPEYAGGETRELKPNMGDVVALEGSMIGLKLTASVPLSSGQIEFATGEPVRLEVGGNERREASGHFELRRSGNYAIRLMDTNGLSNLRPPRYSLTAEPDQPPLAIVTSPARDLILPANSRLELVLEAEDDIGLTRLALQRRRGADGWQTLKAWPVAERGVRRRAERVGLSLPALGLQVGDVLRYRVVAWDNRRPKPNRGIGRTWSITVAEPSHDRALLAAETRRLLEALQRILALQRENRTALDLDRALEPIRARQQQIRRLTVEVIAEQRKAIRPTESLIARLEALADGLMLEAVQLLADYGGPYQQRIKKKEPILDVMDKIIARLQALIGKVDRALGTAEQAQAVLEQLPPPQREQALKRIHDLLEKLRDFVPEQDKVIAETEELVRKGEDLTEEDLEKLERLKGTEDKWAEVFTDSVRDIAKLTEQGFADTSIANDYKEMVEQIEAASLNLTPELIELAVPREQAGRELAESLVEEMEMWIPNSPDYIKWMMEEPLDFPEIPMVELPDQLWDLIGDLIEEQDALNDAAEDMTSAWADSLAEGAGWEVAGGPISNFSAVGKTGNQLPDNNELSGRSGDGRSGRSQGQLVENVAKGLRGRVTPTRVTNDPYEQGVVKELQQMATSGATGGGKARGAGQEGLQGQSPPPLMENMQFMTDWQQRIRQRAERVAGQLKVVRISLPALDRAIALMRKTEQAAEDGRYAELFKIQQMVLQNLRMSGELAMREMALSIDRAYYLPADQRRPILDAMDEPVPQEYQDAVRRYFQQLSESE